MLVPGSFANVSLAADVKHQAKGLRCTAAHCSSKHSRYALTVLCCNRQVNPEYSCYCCQGARWWGVKSCYHFATRAIYCDVQHQQSGDAELDFAGARVGGRGLMLAGPPLVDPLQPRREGMHHIHPYGNQVLPPQAVCRPDNWQTPTSTVILPMRLHQATQDTLHWVSAPP